MKILSIVLASFVFLASCAPDTVPIVKEKPLTIEVPASLLVKCGIPSPPARGSTQRDVATYVLSMNRALENCASRHTELVGVITDFQKSVADRAKAEE